MELFYVISGVYFLSILFLLVRGFIVYTMGGYNSNSFLQREHTDTIKGIAAVGIVLMHIATHTKGIQLSGIPYYYVKFCKTLGCMGVNLFFFLSGYGNYYSISKTENRKDRLKWLWNHVSHIVVMYLICYAVCLIVLICMGYKTNLSETVYNLTHLRGPLSQIWYLRIQLLLYFILVLSKEMKGEKEQIGSIFLLSFISQLIFYKLGFGEEWWMSTLCFGVGYLFPKWKNTVIYQIQNHNFIAVISLIPVFLFAFYLVFGSNNFILKVLGNAILSVDMILFAEIIMLNSGIYRLISNHTIYIYIIHVTFVVFLISDQIPTNLKVAAVFLLTPILSLVCDFIFNKFHKIIEKTGF